MRTIRLDLGEREDTATVEIGIATTLLGGPGADRLTAGPANDQLSGDDGDDVLAGASGAGEGDDDVRVRDGIQDVVRCGDGSTLDGRRRHRPRREFACGTTDQDQARVLEPADHCMPTGISCVRGEDVCCGQPGVRGAGRTRYAHTVYIQM